MRIFHVCPWPLMMAVVLTVAAAATSCWWLILVAAWFLGMSLPPLRSDVQEAVRRGRPGVR